MDEPTPMTHLVALLATGSLVYASTNVDDLLLLVAFLAHPDFSGAQVVLGQFVGRSVLLLVALLASGAATVLSPPRIGLLGLVPLGLGIWRLWRLHNHPLPEEAWATSAPAARLAPMLSVALATISDGGDNLAAYVPYFAVQSRWDVAATIALFLGLTAAWCVAARLVLAQPAAGPLLRRSGRAALPWIMLGLGVVILVRSGAIGLA
jgi:cadmium resistance protein CadD (predicted permease)